MSFQRSLHHAFRAANVLCLILFSASAALQLNDPDPVGWFAIYALAGLACLACWRLPRPLGWLLPAAVGVAALGWAASLAPVALPGLKLGQLVQKMKAETPQIELGREMLGLLMVSGWMAVLAVVMFRRTARG